ncbi:transmembrane protein 79-like [Saccostrea echinata]|uniref:transmembrane protein 79-like n=1 Tax=Saccostrea echinata TaxID=191078 RepID=UPI002A82D2EB|nr:transmembrane protein 79-like [Saccostrea echinata]
MESKEKKKPRLLIENMPWIRIQMISAIATSLLLFTVCFWTLPINTSGLKDPAGRLAFAIRWLFISSLSMIFALFGVLRVRGSSNAVDPINGGAEHLIEVPNRILRNTVEQYFLHMAGVLTLSTILDASSLKVIPILAGLFLLGRFTYGVGYSQSPFNRSFGFIMTFIPTLLVYVYCTYRMFTGNLLLS